MKKETPDREKTKKVYEKPVLVRHQNLKTITAGGTPNGSPTPLGCTRAY